jgi:EmrB/QacA subfamily drug resistance transporter
MRASPAVARSIHEAGAGETNAAIRRYLPWLVAVALFMENLDATIVNTAVPTMAAALGVPPLSLKAVLTSYTLSLAVFIPVSGWMADRFGTLRIFAGAVGIFTIGSLLCGISVNVPMLVASRILQGIGGAMMTPVGRLALVRSFPRSELMSAMNYVVIPALIGPLVGPFVGGLIIHWLPWRTIFLVNLPFGVAGLWMVRRYMPDFRVPGTPPLDRTGFVLFGGGVALLSYVLEIFGEHRLGAGPVSLLAALSAMLLATYGWHSRRVVAPMLPLGLFRTRTFRVSVVGGFITRIGIGGMPFLLPLLYQLGMGFPAWKAGLFTMPQAIAAMGMKVIGRKLLTRFGHRCVLMTNTALVGLAICLFASVGPSTPIGNILLLSLAFGFLASLQFTSMNTLVYADVDDRDASKAGSIASTSQQMSLSFGVAFAALLAGWYLGHVDQRIPAQAIPALHKAFLTMGALTIFSSLTFRTLRPTDGNNVSNRVVRVVEAH